MSKKKYSPEKIIKVIQEYLQGKGSSYELAKKYDLSAKTITRWYTNIEFTVQVLWQ